MSRFAARVACLALLACAALIAPRFAGARTSDVDKTALLAFKAALVTDQVGTGHTRCLRCQGRRVQGSDTAGLREQLGTGLVQPLPMQGTPAVHSLRTGAERRVPHPQGLLASWSVRSDPCDDAWALVSCNCSETAPPLVGVDCAAANGGPGSRRVLVTPRADQRCRVHRGP